MPEPTINDGIQTMITTEIQNQRPLPQKVTVTTIHNNGYIDITTTNGTLMKNIQYTGTPTLNQTAILLHIENNEKIVIT